jgi:hypothetical protein
LPDIPAVKCAESFGQIQKVAFQRLTKDDGSKNSFTTEKAITLLASWTPLLSAANSTKIVVSPYIQAPTNRNTVAGICRRGFVRSAYRQLERCLFLFGKTPNLSYSKFPVRVIRLGGNIPNRPVVPGFGIDN